MKKNVSQIRHFNRFYTSHLGILDNHFLESAYSLSEVRVLYEVGERSLITAQQLSEQLKLDKGYLSRMIKSMMKSGLLSKAASAADGRALHIRLTDAGRSQLDELKEKSDRQIGDFISRLNADEQALLVNSMRTIENLLSAGYTTQGLAGQVVYQEGLKAGDIGYLIHLHGVLYAREEGYSDDFEAYVVKTFCDFLDHYDSTKDKVWLARYNGEIIGCIAVQSRPDNAAQMRWFLVCPVFRGTGIGKKLLDTALSYCLASSLDRVYLLTTDVQKKAISMYKKAGFELTSSAELQQWGQVLREERYDLLLGDGARSTSI
ncbi:MAG: bifunctional helix-turn-helix transcriptional regulator/GNAT family N-acetyltransferase [Dyadobacter sp.]|uniref:bifunctional helix-turn-helix transcriptional regulator/GNAT family N-acetyltransferase n=1 Tax=Dyadobacter sp. TaxID=1914288 RepID=UPI001B26FF9C|nr:bifunctional helix-turn-helix transcriptional regulator/GNAT family N-acetyltransferase [Dyadobacter sp.]MBO9611389.1 bifunctional helix-turn-helix transcriptional regulator/GNAT family N-acetyltransferase [Dyadobacter sp.]